MLDFQRVFFGIVLEKNEFVLMVDKDHCVGGLLVGKVEYRAVGLLEGLHVGEDQVLH